MQRQTQSQSHALKVAARMPLLRHHMRDEPFDILRSDVVAWLVSQPEIAQELFNYVRRHGAIVYVDGRWCGAETQSELK
jgi:hypothetical protein